MNDRQEVKTPSLCKRADPGSAVAVPRGVDHVGKIRGDAVNMVQMINERSVIVNRVRRSGVSDLVKVDRFEDTLVEIFREDRRLALEE